MSLLKPFEQSAKIEPQQSVDFIQKVYKYTTSFIGEGVTVPKPVNNDDYAQAAQDTLKLIDSGHDIIYGAVIHDPINNTYVRASALVKTPDNTFDVIKITASTSIKTDHRWDIAKTYHGFKNAGISLNRANILHVDKTYQRDGDIDSKKFLKKVNVTRSLKKPEEVAEKYRSEQRESLKTEPNTKQDSDNDQAKHDPKQIKGFIDKLEYPLYFLDYETVSSPVPLFDNTRPYQQVPFQFSLHIQHEPDGEIEHHEFIHKEITDPRHDLTRALLNACGENGTILVYFEAFEKGRNKELAEAFPEHADALYALNARVMDLYEPFKKRWLYSPEQNGSASIKAVLPAFTDLKYDDLNIKKGDVAAQEYLDFVEGLKTPEEQEQLWEDLLAYCKLDTYAMVELLNVLKFYQIPRPEQKNEAKPTLAK